MKLSDEVVYGDSGYLGLEKRDEVQASKHLSSIEYKTNKRPSSMQKLPANCYDCEKEREHRKSSVRCKVEHVFLIMKQFFGFRKAIYKGIVKNTHRLKTLMASSNLVMLARSQKDLCTS